MASFAVLIKKNGRLDENNRGAFSALAGKLKSQKADLSDTQYGDDFLLATKCWPVHSRSQGIAVDERTGSWLMCVGNPYKESYRGISNEKFAQAVLDDYLERGQEVATEFNAPFVFAIYDGRDNSYHLFTDRVGLQHVYMMELPDCIVFATSALAVASTWNVHLDTDGVTSFFLTGYLLGQSTFFKEIKKVKGGMHVKVCNGVVAQRAYWEPPDEDSANVPIEKYADELMELHSAAVCGRLGDRGDTTIEVTGGFDSRFNLACAVAAGKDFIGWTIGEPGCSEVEIGQKLRQVCQFPYHVLSPTEGDLPETFMDDLELLVQLTDGETNCLTLIASPSSNRRSEGFRDSSISGFAGEILRGTYNPFFSRNRRSSLGVSVERYLQFKNLRNVCGDMSVFANLFPDDYSEKLRQLIHACFEKTINKPFHWRVANFYFMGPAQRFVGRCTSLNNFFYRSELPFFDNEEVDLSFRVPHQYKAKSRLVKHAIASVYPAYGEILLDNRMPARPLQLKDLPRLLKFKINYGKRVFKRVLISKYGNRNKSSDTAGVYDQVAKCLNRQEVLALLEPDNMASHFLYDPDSLRLFVKNNVENGFRERTQIGLMLTFELMCRQIGHTLKL